MLSTVLGSMMEPPKWDSISRVTAVTGASSRPAPRLRVPAAEQPSWPRASLRVSCRKEAGMCSCGHGEGVAPHTGLMRERTQRL